MPGVAASVALSAVVWLPLLVLLMIWRAARRRPATPVRRMAASEESGTAVRERGPASAKASRSRVMPSAGSSKDDAPEPAALTRAQETLVVRLSDGLSLYDHFLGLGSDPDTLHRFRNMMREPIRATAWAAAMGGEAELLRNAGLEWVKDVAAQRLAAWLAAHPLVKEKELRVQLPASLEEDELENLTLTQADGLGVSLSEGQKSLLLQARRTLARVLASSYRPFPLLVAAGATGTRALLPAHLREVSDETRTPWALSLLLEGMVALDWTVAAGLNSSSRGAELRDHLHEHRKLVGTSVPAEGCAVHAIQALGEAALEGVGILFAAAAGAAFSPSTVVLRLTQRVAAIRATPVLDALARLGTAAVVTLEDTGAKDRATLLDNLGGIFGAHLLEQELKRTAALVKEVERLSSKDPLWRHGPDSSETPDLALVTLHLMKVQGALSQTAPAVERSLAVFYKLAYAGATPEEQRIAARRMGYAVAALGMPFLRGTSTDLLSAGRDALAALGSAVPP
jgi:hypothetical protein